jgi:hypothetical protein
MPLERLLSLWSLLSQLRASPNLSRAAFGLLALNPHQPSPLKKVKGGADLVGTLVAAEHVSDVRSGQAFWARDT